MRIRETPKGNVKISLSLDQAYHLACILDHSACINHTTEMFSEDEIEETSMELYLLLEQV